MKSNATMIALLSVLSTIRHPNRPHHNMASSFLLKAAQQSHRGCHHFHCSAKVASCGYPRKSTPLYLNRILFDSSEMEVRDHDTAERQQQQHWLATVTFPKHDYRTVHIAKILRLKNGECVRAGSVRNPESGHNDELEGLLTDEAIVQWLPEGNIKKCEPTKNGDPPGSLKLCIPHPPKTLLWNQRNNTNHSHDDNGQQADVPPVSLLLALPRPLQLSRILPMVSQLGIDHLILTSAKKVPKDYFGSHLFRKPQELRSLLIEGLTQSGTDLRLPRVTISKRPLREFMDEELDDLFPPREVVRVIAHPERRKLDGETEDEGTGKVRRVTDLDFPMDKQGKRRKMLVAVGPEGGWEEPNELDMFMERGFQKVTLGTRALRSDVAVVSLLALAHEVCSKHRYHD
ncbi:hypothetical protein HJC23_007932 [Cyclotella cryptica]|uniref:16S rRNA (uracil(1498)-N(3))-methyltransferase n=1 Tax=Cyclotella cryptica TaxID=29204 RepID=A0ABD3PCW2_9STRA|eukprot:CCRYP_016199-RA/>CCRYP_016199-RA protein AED:0.04 eAED:0.04 QI:402/1/1/1/0.33/0.25/4/98/400